MKNFRENKKKIIQEQIPQKNLKKNISDFIAINREVSLIVEKLLTMRELLS